MQTTRYAVVMENTYAHRFNEILGDWELVLVRSEECEVFSIEGMGYGALASMAKTRADELNKSIGCETIQFKAEPRDY